MNYVLKTHIIGRQNGVTGTMTAQRAVSGTMLDGMKNGASGKMIGVGNTTVDGRRI